MSIHEDRFVRCDVEGPTCRGTTDTALPAPTEHAAREHASHEGFRRHQGEDWCGPCWETVGPDRPLRTRPLQP